jgi:hypothetical protein
MIVTKLFYGLGLISMMAMPVLAVAVPDPGLLPDTSALIPRQLGDPIEREPPGAWRVSILFFCSMSWRHLTVS